MFYSSKSIYISKLSPASEPTGLTFPLLKFRSLSTRINFPVRQIAILGFPVWLPLSSTMELSKDFKMCLRAKDESSNAKCCSQSNAAVLHTAKRRRYNEPRLEVAETRKVGACVTRQKKVKVSPTAMLTAMFKR